MSTAFVRKCLLIGLSLVLLAGLPLAGVGLAGKPARQYLEFPPRTQYVAHAPFSVVAFITLTALVLAVVLPWIIRVVRAQHRVSTVPGTAGRLPWWGWLGLTLSAATWVLAWNRFPWFTRFQPYTFTPLWAGYILGVNGLTFRRSGQCMLTARPGYFVLLFPLSAGFWWYFEYLNRFVQNWYYSGVNLFTAGEYALHATLSFATVLPAVLGTREWLATYPRLYAGLEAGGRSAVPRPRCLAWAVLGLGGMALALIGVWPDFLFPLVWIAPLVTVSCVQALTGRPTVFAGAARGDWRDVWLLALAALCCGCFWEMWNDHSLAKWIYTVPFVNRFHLFEMPLLGYAGYLPFGLECQAIADLFLVQPGVRKDEGNNRGVRG